MSTQFPSQAAATFVFDGGCGFCARSARALRRITVAGGSDGLLDDVPPPSLQIASSSDFPFDAIGVDATLIERHALYVEERPPGAPPFVALGAAAIGHALRDHGRTRFWRVAGAVLLNPLVRAPASIVYRLIADNRAAVSRATSAVVKRTQRR